MGTQLSLIENKIIDNETDLKKKLAVARFKGYKIVFTNGCFDILHKGHVEYLSKAADCGDLLVIGLNTDNSVSRIKGPERPIQNEDARGKLLGALQFVDMVTYFDEETPYDLINLVQPDVLVKGADYKAHEIVGYDIVMAKGGRVETIELSEGYSTTNIIHKIKNT